MEGFKIPKKFDSEGSEIKYSEVLRDPKILSKPAPIVKKTILINPMNKTVRKLGKALIVGGDARRGIKGRTKEPSVFKEIIPGISKPENYTSQVSNLEKKYKQFSISKLIKEEIKVGKRLASATIEYERLIKKLGSGGLFSPQVITMQSYLKMLSKELRIIDTYRGVIGPSRSVVMMLKEVDSNPSVREYAEKFENTGCFTSLENSEHMECSGPEPIKPPTKELNPLWT